MSTTARMVTKDSPLIPNSFGWAVSHKHHALPAGLPHRTVVEVIENRVGETTIIVRDRAGNRFTVYRDNVVPRRWYRYEKEQKFYPEHTDRGQRILWEEIRFQEEVLQLQKKQIEELYWCVRRSGNDEWIQRLEEHLETHNADL